MGGVVAPVAEPSEAAGDSDCVEWLRHYRWVVTQLVHHPQLGQGDGFEERVRGEVHSALRKAYFGPTVRSPTLPSCFEAEERAQPGGVMDVLHLVSGRQLLGVVRQVGGFFLPEEEKAAGFLPFDRGGAAGFSATSGPGASFRGTRESSCGRQTVKGGNSVEDVSGASVDLELHLFGKVVAKASRKAGKGPRLDEIFVHLSGEPEDDEEQPVNSDTNSDILLGSIRGIGSSANSCAVHDAQGKKTHFILQHWTPMVGTKLYVPSSSFTFYSFRSGVAARSIPAHLACCKQDQITNIIGFGFSISGEAYDVVQAGSRTCPMRVPESTSSFAFQQVWFELHLSELSTTLFCHGHIWQEDHQELLLPR